MIVKLPPSRLFRSWLSLAGLVIAGSALFAFVLLFAIDLMAHHGNPYMGILAYVVAPGFLFLGLGLMGLGWWIHRRHELRSHPGAAPHVLTIDFSRAREWRLLACFVAGTVAFLMLTAFGSYQTYHITESVMFCGQACHGPMKPEYTAYQHSPHANVRCVECHVGPGAGAYFNAKINGVRQLVCTITGDISRPIKTPVHNMRSAAETCEQCHWPQKHNGNLEHTYHHFLADETNTAFSVRMLLKVGSGGGPAHGGSSGIHWHVDKDIKVEYVAADEQRLIIPLVRLTDAKGNVTEFRSTDYTNALPAHAPRTMDCLDCHNRPAHRFRTPNAAVDAAMAAGRIDPALPWVKSNVVASLVQNYATESEALAKIDSTLRAAYKDHPRATSLIAEAQTIFQRNFFPEMKADWRAYPDHSSHKDSAGCFRCHDGKHKTADGKRTLGASDCNSCHLILAQGAGAQLEQLNPRGHPFIHIDAEYSDLSCAECHTGAFPK
ncbi:MAG: NapC/NirT family cytochrome c [Verrucomicrobiota bacterium]